MTHRTARRYTPESAIAQAKSTLIDAGWIWNDDDNVWNSPIVVGGLVAELTLTADVAFAMIHTAELYDTSHLGPLSEIYKQ